MPLLTWFSNTNLNRRAMQQKNVKRRKSKSRASAQGSQRYNSQFFVSALFALVWPIQLWVYVVIFGVVFYRWMCGKKSNIPLNPPSKGDCGPVLPTY
jgi:uncharacterized membrane protein